MSDAEGHWTGTGWGAYAPVILAAVSYVANTIYATLESQRANQLDRVNQQIKLLYGPINAFNEIDSMTWQVFLKEIPGDESRPHAHVVPYLSSVPCGVHNFLSIPTITQTTWINSPKTRNLQQQ